MTKLTDKEARELWVLLQLREALGDPTGKLMHDALVERARDAWADAQLYRMRRAAGADSARIDAERAERAEAEPATAPIWETLAEIGASAPAGTWDAPQEQHAMSNAPQEQHAMSNAPRRTQE